MLADAIEARGLNQPKVAAALDVTQPTVSGWLSNAVPKAHHRTALRLLLGVPEESWLDEEDLRTIELARAAASEAAAPTDPVPATEPAPDEVA